MDKTIRIFSSLADMKTEEYVDCQNALRVNRYTQFRSSARLSIR